MLEHNEDSGLHNAVISYINNINAATINNINAAANNRIDIIDTVEEHNDTEKMEVDESRYIGEEVELLEDIDVIEENWDEEPTGAPNFFRQTTTVMPTKLVNDQLAKLRKLCRGDVTVRSFACIG